MLSSHCLHPETLDATLSRKAPPFLRSHYYSHLNSSKHVFIHMWQATLRRTRIPAPPVSEDWLDPKESESQPIELTLIYLSKFMFA